MIVYSVVARTNTRPCSCPPPPCPHPCRCPTLKQRTDPDFWDTLCRGEERMIVEYVNIYQNKYWKSEIGKYKVTGEEILSNQKEKYWAAPSLLSRTSSSLRQRRHRLVLKPCLGSSYPSQPSWLSQFRDKIGYEIILFTCMLYVSYKMIKNSSSDGSRSSSSWREEDKNLSLASFHLFLHFFTFWSFLASRSCFEIGTLFEDYLCLIHRFVRFTIETWIVEIWG